MQPYRDDIPISYSRLHDSTTGLPTMVIDCIDDVSSKADLISFCSTHHIPIVTSMGAGGKSDPTKLRISSLYDVINDPLAQKIRWKLRKMRDADLTRDVMCVYSGDPRLMLHLA